MIEITPEKIAQWVKETKESAERFDNEWDRLAIHWPLTSESIVFEIGSFKGRWAYQIATRYNPWLYCFEPQEWAYQVTWEVLREFKKARVFNFGLGNQSGTLKMSKAGTDGCVFSDNGEGEFSIEDIEWMVTEPEMAIDLCLINIEGYEYTLIPYMMQKNIKPRWLMVQCHGNPTDYQKLRDLLSQSYNVLWDYGTTLTAWERKQ